MGLTAALVLFFVVLVIYIIIIDIFTGMMRATGMSADKARFQVISLLTNSGYTTNESEIVVRVLARRRLARKIMLFGYVFSVTIISVFINMMITLPAAAVSEIWPELLIVCVVFVAFLLIKQIPGVKRFFSRIIEKRAKKWLFKKESENMMVLLDEYPKGVVAQIILNVVPGALTGKTIREADLMGVYGIHVIFLRRDGEPFSYGAENEPVLAGDRLMVFGDAKKIKEAFNISE